MSAGRLFFSLGTRRLEIQPGGFMPGDEGETETETVLGGRHLLGQNSPKPHPSTILYVLPSFPKTMGSSGRQGQVPCCVALPSAVATTGHAPLLRPIPTRGT